MTTYFGVFDISNGGNFNGATPFAFSTHGVFGGISGRYLAWHGNGGIWDYTLGGDLAATTPVSSINVINLLDTEIGLFAASLDGNVTRIRNGTETPFASGLDLDFLQMAYVPVPASDPDLDRDGIPNGSDDCPFLANSQGHDADEDGIGDACDDSDNHDLDDDGVDNDRDNCPFVANRGQDDDDSDGLGNPCDDHDDGGGCSAGGSGAGLGLALLLALLAVLLRAHLRMETRASPRAFLRRGRARLRCSSSRR
jgi:hypothetical protein